MSTLVPPHGGKLKSLLVTDEVERSRLHKYAQGLHKISLSSQESSDVIMMASGAYSPLDGFMSEADYRAVLSKMHLENGTLWPIPVTLAVTDSQACRLNVNQDIALVDPATQDILAILKLKDKYTYCQKREAVSVFGTDDGDHPGVRKLYQKPDVYVGGSLTVLGEGRYPQEFPHYANCAQTRRFFSEAGWQTIAAFQTRNPIHRSHEYLTKIALELCDGLFIHPVVGQLKAGDIPAQVRLKCYRAILDSYYPKERVLLRVYPLEMRYAGPKEAVLHAIIRQNFGCSHMIVGRDHAGVGDYYDPFAAHRIFDSFSDNALAITPLKFDWTFWCYECGGMASSRTCPHQPENHCLISGTRLRQMLMEGASCPPEFSRPEVLAVLKEYYKNTGTHE